MSRWPQVVFDGVPSIAEASSLASLVRRKILSPPDRLGRCSVERLARAARADVADRDFRDRSDYVLGMLIPVDDDRFAIRVDPSPRRGWDLDAELQADTARKRRRFIVAHELAHTFFYERAPGARPRRQVRDSPKQESFCHQFARDVLVPPQAAGAADDPEHVFRLHREYDVSVQVAARAFARAHRRELAVGLWYWTGDGSSVSLRCQWASRPRAFAGMRADLEAVVADIDGDVGPLQAGLAVAAEPRRRQLVVISRV